MKGPSRFRPEVLEVFLDAIGEGCTIADACKIAGISDRTYRDWRARGDDPSDPRAEEYKAFVVAVERAQATVRRDMLKIIRRAAKRNWTAAAWYLERTDTANWGRKRIEVATGGGAVPYIEIGENEPDVEPRRSDAAQEGVPG